MTRFTLFIKYSRAGRPKEVAGLLAKTMMPHVDGLPTNAEQLVRQKLLADVIGKAAEDADDESLLFGISKVAEVLAVNATDEEAEVYWTGILANTVTELSKRVGAEPTTEVRRVPEPKQGTPSTFFPGATWNPDIVSPESAPFVDAMLRSGIARVHCPKRFHWRCDH